MTRRTAIIIAWATALGLAGVGYGLIKLLGATVFLLLLILAILLSSDGVWRIR